MASRSLLAFCSAVLCRWVADDAEQSGALVRFYVRLQPQFPRRSRMKRERRLRCDDGWSESFLIARRAVTSADTRVNSSKVRVRLWITEEISSLFTLDHLSSPSDADAAASADDDDDDDALNATCVIFPPVKASSLLCLFIRLSRHQRELKRYRFAIVSHSKKEKKLRASRHIIPIAEIR